jgi:hypothetical protein
MNGAGHVYQWLIELVNAKPPPPILDETVRQRLEDFDRPIRIFRRDQVFDFKSDRNDPAVLWREKSCRGAGPKRIGVDQTFGLIEMGQSTGVAGDRAFHVLVDLPDRGTARLIDCTCDVVGNPLNQERVLGKCL